MTSDFRLVGHWLDTQDLSSQIQFTFDPPSGDLWSTSAIRTPVPYFMPDGTTLQYPMGKDMWLRVGATFDGSAMGCWSRQPRPGETNFKTELMFLRPDGFYASVTEGENTFCSGFFELTSTPQSNFLSIGDYRARLHTSGNAYRFTQTNGAVETGTYALTNADATLIFTPTGHPELTQTLTRL